MESAEKSVPDFSVKMWSKPAIYELIRGAPERITYIYNESPKATSDIWAKFKIICIDGIVVDFVKCNDCISVFQWTSKVGTGTLHRHKCNIPELKFQHTDITGAGSQLKLTQLVPRKVPPQEIQRLNDAVVIGLAKDLRPLSTVESKGFRHLAQALITFGAKYGNHAFPDVVHCRRTLKEKHLPRLANSERSDTKQTLSMAPSSPYFTFTFDLWTETRKQRHFLSLTCHFVDEDFKLQSKLLGAHEFPVDLRKTTVNIRDQISKVLSQYFDEATIPDMLNQSFAVTDGGSNVVGVFASRLPCMCHKLNLILDNSMAEKNLNDLEEVKGALNTVKSLVTYFKHSGLNSKLHCTLKQSVPTRWNSQITMLESYKKSAAEVQELLLQNKQLNRLVGLDEQLVSDLINLFKPFEQISDTFSSENMVTIDQVVPKYHVLQRHLDDNDSDSDVIRRLKLKMREKFQRYYVLETAHFAALALNPRFKSLKFCTDDQKSNAYDFIRGKMALFSTISNDIELHPAPAKRPKQEGVVGYLEDSDNEDAVENPEDELALYLQSRIKKGSSDDEMDLLMYWKGAHQYPKLRKTALWILSIPASSAADERTFSATGHLISDRRCQLGGSTVDDLTILHKNNKF